VSVGHVFGQLRYDIDCFGTDFYLFEADFKTLIYVWIKETSILVE
jgi:hypothetical protein